MSTKLLLVILVAFVSVPSYGAHPSLFLTPSVLTFLRTKQASRDSDWLELKERADALLGYSVSPYQRTGCSQNTICYAYQGHSWLTAVQVLGLAYQITGDVAYARQVIAIVDVMNAPFKSSGSVDPLSTDRGYPSRSAALALALAFDWVYDQLGSDRRMDTINTLNAWFDWMKSSAYQRAGPAYGNYFGGHVLGFGAAGYATEGDNPRAAEIRNHIAELFADNVPEAFSSGGFAGGYAPESYNYGSFEFVYLFQYMQIVKDNTGQDMGLATYGGKVARNLLYTLKPNRWQSTDEGDYPGDYRAIMPGLLPLLLASALEGTMEGKWMQWFYTHLAEPPANGRRVQTPDVFSRLLYANPPRDSLDYRLSEPAFFRSGGDEHVYVRSDWSDNAVWASFAAGARYWAVHESKKAGHLAIQRGNDYLLVNSGQWKGTNGVVGRPSSFSLASWRANTLFFDDFGEYLYTTSDNGPQTVWGTNRVLSYDVGDHYIYSQADLTEAYDKRPDQRNPNTRSLRSYVRSFVFLGDDYFVVWDRVEALKTTYKKAIFWHFNPSEGAPEVDGTLLRTSVGNSALYVKTLLPAAPLVTVVPDGARTFTDPTPITYRAEVSDSSSGPTLNVLTVLKATSNRDLFPPTNTLNVVTGNMVGTLIADQIPRVVLLSSNGTKVSQVIYGAHYSGIGRHVIVDLVPGAYDVQRDGVEVIRMLSTTDAGVLEFEVTGGTTFSVTRREPIDGSIIKVSGDLQVARAGTAVPEPVVVKIMGRNGSPLTGIAVKFRLLGGRATLSASGVSSGEDGSASIRILLLEMPGPVAIEASNLGLSQSSVTFNLASVEDRAGQIIPEIDDVISSNGFPRRALTAGSIVTLFGRNLAARIASAETVPLPTSLAGVRVETNGFLAPLFYVSPFQINFQLPWELSSSQQVAITVTAEGFPSVSETIPLVSFSPGLFSLSSGGQGAIVISQSGEVAAVSGSLGSRPARPARRGEFISMFCSGLGAVTNEPATGDASNGNPIPTMTIPTVLIGEAPVPITPGFFSGLAPSYPGLYQVNVQIPNDAPTGETVPVTLAIGGVTSNTVTIAVQ